METSDGWIILVLIKFYHNNHWYSITIAMKSVWITVNHFTRKGCPARPCNFINYIFIELDQQLECMKYLQYLRGHCAILMIEAHLQYLWSTSTIPVRVCSTCEAHLQYMLESAVPEIQLICHLLKVMHQGPTHSNWYCGCAWRCITLEFHLYVDISIYFEAIN